MEYIPVNCCNIIVQSAVNSHRERDENPNSSVVAETMKLPANKLLRPSNYGSQSQKIKVMRKHMRLSTQICSRLFFRLDYIKDQLYELELAEAEIEHREPIIVGFFILQHAKLRMLELCYKFFGRFCDVNKFEEFEMDTDSLYLAQSEKELYDFNREESEGEWELMRTEDSKDDFTTNGTTKFSLEPATQNIRNMTNKSLVFSKRNVVVPKCCVNAVRPIVVMTPIPTNTNSAAKV